MRSADDLPKQPFLCLVGGISARSFTFNTDRVKIVQMLSRFLADFMRAKGSILGVAQEIKKKRKVKLFSCCFCLKLCPSIYRKKQKPPPASQVF